MYFPPLIPSKTSMFLARLYFCAVSLAQPFLSLLRKWLCLRSNLPFALTLAKGNFQTGRWERSQLPKLCPSGLLAARGAAHRSRSAPKPVLPPAYLTADRLHEQTDQPEGSSLGLLLGVGEFPVSLEDRATSWRILPATRSQ